ncbi:MULTISPECIES: prephenate dehydrogenase [Rufibacter]|uniref:Prephenate dehydrogenase n=1 Tax=Rufibacter quisquiliarum TaxID=1549639 RepID=A0A839GFJ1_9BACT|nr:MULTISPECIES: prephenate dehydrogenase [Rufibacter]MBA9076323.1 prephenate dehydrogenase [Rufibacter quisquiliarum]
MKTFTIIGTGLIGGSVARDIRKTGTDAHLIGVEQNADHAARALELQLVDAVLPLSEAVAQADVVLLAIPVTAIQQLLPQLLDLVPPQAVVIDFGSTKSLLCEAVKDHPKRAQFVAAHPIAGTENSGPEAALEGLYQGKMNIICEKEKSSEFALEVALELFDLLGLKTVFMQAEEHDKHVAYISHLSHVSSFLLGLTVLDVEKDEKNIFMLAGSGFASTVRLAKSSPDMWAPIFEQNAFFLSHALEEYIKHLQKFQECLQQKDTAQLYEMMRQANQIRPVLDGITQGASAK